LQSSRQRFSRCDRLIFMNLLFCTHGLACTDVGRIPLLPSFVLSQFHLRAHLSSLAVCPVHSATGGALLRIRVEPIRRRALQHSTPRVGRVPAPVFPFCPEAIGSAGRRVSGRKAPTVTALVDTTAVPSRLACSQLTKHGTALCGESARIGF